MSNRAVIEGEQEQGPNEETPWTIDVENVGDGSTPSSPTMKVFEMPARTDVTTGTTSGAMSVSGTIITTKTIKSLADDKRYLVEVYYTQSGSKRDNHFFIRCKEPT